MDIEQHSAELLAQGVAPYRVAKFKELAGQGKLTRAFRVLHRPICGARRRHGAGICFTRPVHNGRCLWHGGGTATPGARTVAGIERIRQAQLRRWATWRLENGRPPLPEQQPIYSCATTI
jgi:hypothetical protein